MTPTATDPVRGEALEAPWSPGGAAPATPAPLGATDCHHHIFDPRFQADSDVPNVPPATVDDYRVFMRRLGLSRSIVVQASNYGTHNGCLLDALEQLGSDKARGVAIVDPDVSGAELDRLHSGGVRGLRLYLAKGRIPTAEEVRTLAGLAADRGWSLQFVGNRQKEVLLGWETVFRDLPCPIVIDHFGWTPQPSGVDSATGKLLMRLLGTGGAYVKMSGLYLSSQDGWPDYRDLNPLAAALIGDFPDRLIWGTDWPHPMAGADRPDGAMLFDRLAQWAPDAATRRRILVENPDRLYWAD